MLQVVNLCKSYFNKKSETEILKNININFENNGFVSILGPSGCGKTTLLNLLGGLDFATKGQILIDGKDITKLSNKKIDAYRNNSIGTFGISLSFDKHSSISIMSNTLSILYVSVFFLNLLLFNKLINPFIFLNIFYIFL